MVERELEIVRARGRARHFVAVAVVEERFHAVLEFKIVGDALEARFEPDLVPVKIPIRPEFLHRQRGKLQFGGHHGAVGIVKPNALRFALSGAQAEYIVRVVQREGEFAHRPVKYRCGIHSLSFHGAADNAGNIVFLHAEEQQHDRDRHNDSARAENGVVFINVRLVHHGVKALGDGEVIIIVLHNDRDENVIDDGVYKGVDGGRGDDGLGVRQDDLPEHRAVRGAVEDRRFVQRFGDGVKIALGDVVIERRAAGIDEDQSKQRLIQTDGLHKVVNGDDAHKAGEHAQHERGVHKEPALREAQPGIDIRHHQREHRCESAAAPGDEERVAEPAREVEQPPVGKEADIIIKGKRLRPEIGRIRALLRPEGRNNQPEHRHEPQNGKDRKKRVERHGRNTAADACIFHWN